MELKIKLGKSKLLNNIRCILATQKILKNELIESCPIILLSNKDMNLISETVLTKYEFYWNKTNEALALGYGSLYNHSFEPNVKFKINAKDKTMEFTALRDIEANEELFINYMQGKPNKKIPQEYLDLKH